MAAEGTWTPERSAVSTAPAPERTDGHLDREREAAGRRVGDCGSSPGPEGTHGDWGAGGATVCTAPALGLGRWPPARPQEHAPRSLPVKATFLLQLSC